MNILVTGAAGFIGSHLVEQLLAMGHSIISLDNLSTGKKAYLDSSLSHENHTFVHGSILDRSLLIDLMDSCDAVIHLAAVLGVKNLVNDPLKVIEGNIDGTRNILEIAYAKRIKVVFASTSEIYGKNEKIPYTEESDRVLGPTSKNRWCYATAKALDEHLCFAYAEKGLPVTIVRYFNAYGPRAQTSDYGMVIPKFIKLALKGQPITVYGDGTQTRSFTYIDDTIQGTILCIDNKWDGEVFNIGRPEEISINELAEKIKQMCQSNSDIVHIPYEEVYGDKYEDTNQRVPDITKSEQLLQFHPSTSINDGLQQTIEWYKNAIDGREQK
ncbi:NAD-dependent epimerase/dehydratase family protein [Oceanobacillus piezotolerans]|uniref:NAD-dependent epimerase/dehydratase family protein n=1 Tax=Oceanobacillus piezotolerans TaxID=2448030 RepID=A0A498DG53_9BACI|nr:NAD-dependent epimerase/dehydratase family protein [Oceanobacillus piezotolerans]RLL46921.1 NAD-dependent epimerase/dehydratase family protein [Oceanobacillus piezotolerans]